MTYKLAKKLKEAGFSQSKTPTAYTNEGRLTEWCPECDDYTWGEIDCVNPTLSELIQACGDDFHSLVKRQDGFWDAVPNANVGTPTAKTPEEAVAELYLSTGQK